MLPLMVLSIFGTKYQRSEFEWVFNYSVLLLVELNDLLLVLMCCVYE